MTNTHNRQATEAEAVEWRTTLRLLWIGLGAVCVVAAIWFYSPTAPGHGGFVAAPSSPAPTVREVTYQVEGSGDYAALTLTTPTGMRQLTADLPLQNKSGGFGLVYDFTGYNGGAYVSAQEQSGELDATVTCWIRVNGVVASQNTSTGAYAIASCSAPLA